MKRIILVVSGASYRILAVLGVATLIVLALGTILPQSKGPEIKVTSSQIDMVLAGIVVILALGKAGLATATLTNTGKAFRIAGVLHLLGAILLLTLAYYLIGPLLHLPATPLEPVEPFHLLQYTFPTTTLVTFTLTGLVAWGITIIAGC